MSISNDSSHVELIASSDTTVTTPAGIDVIPKDDLSITGRKSEYSIIGDGIYASVSADHAPGWLTQIIGSVVSSALGDTMSDLANANANILQAISEIEAARNTYDEQINIDATIDSVIASRLATLNASLGATNDSVANIIELQTAFVTEDMAMALSANVIDASLNTPGGTLYGTVGSLQSVIADLNRTVATNYDQVMAEMGDISATVTQEMVAFVTDTGEVGARFKVDLKTAGVKDPDGNPSTLVGGLILESDGRAVSGGFDVDNFWIGRAGNNGKHPFAIQGNDIYFNGKVEFSSVIGDDKPEAGATRNEFKGSWATGVVYAKGDVVTDAGNTWSAKTAHTASAGNRPPDNPTLSSTYWSINASRGESTHVRYSAHADGTDFTVSPTADTLYIGIAVSSTVPETKEGYSWNRYVGYDAAIITLTASGQVFKKTGTQISPAQLVITGVAQNTTINQWEYSVNGGAFTTTLPAGVSRSGNVVSIDGSTSTPSTIVVRASDGTVSDTLSIAVVTDGDNAVTVVLDNEAHLLPADTAGTVSSYVGSGTVVTAYDGANKLTYEAGTGFPSAAGKYRISLATTNITAGAVSLVSGNASIGNHSSITADTAKVTITVNARLFNGTTTSIIKAQVLAKVRDGKNGDPGAQGASSIVIYRNVTAKPSAPTNGSIPSGWSTSVSDSWTGNVWMSRGAATVGSNDIVWGPVELDFSSWRAPNKTTIDGAYIETGTITADKIMAGSITGDKIGAGVIYNAGGTASDYTMKIDLNNGNIHIK